MMAQRLSQDTVLDLRAAGDNSESTFTATGLRRPQRAGLGGIPVEYKGGTIAPPDQRRSNS